MSVQIKLSGILLITISFSVTCAYIVDPGPVVLATKGAVWPKPVNQTTESQFFVVRASVLSFEIVDHNCEILQKAQIRYLQIIGNQISNARKRWTLSKTPNSFPPRRMSYWRQDPLFQGYLNVVKLTLTQVCEYSPHLDMDESYTIKLQNETATIESPSIWGMLRGLETFSQLIYLADDHRSLIINSTVIIDAPRFPHRGLLVDTSRHFLSLFTLYSILDGMTYNKLNVFHWHIVDDHSFPYQSQAFPELSDKGAYHPETMVYSPTDVKNIIEYARIRGIRVMSEFDTPGHTRSWGVSHPEILTECGGEYAGKLGPLDLTKETTLEFVKKLFAEIVDVFPDEYVHLGGDEVGFECWQSNENVRNFLKEHNFTRYEQLEEMYIQDLVDYVTQLNRSSIVWQEVYENGVQLPSATVVHIWTGDSNSLLSRITQAGFKALLSTCWYLDHLKTGGDWQKYYGCDPHDFYGDDEQKKKVMGGEACMWAEVVDNSNVLQRIFPRASAAAEKLWSQHDVTDIEDAKKRIEEHTCRMKFRGIPAQPPNGPGVC